MKRLLDSQWLPLTRRDVWITLLVMALSALIFLPIYRFRILTPTDNDYGSHILFAQQLLLGDPIPAHILAHPLLQLCLAGLVWLSRSVISLWDGMVLSQVASHALTAGLLYVWLPKTPGRGQWLAAGLALGLGLAAPVMLLVLADGQYYFGYIGLASYHNPTVILLRPLALASFILAARVWRPGPSSGWLKLGAAVLVVLSALIKPSYIFIMLPALALLAAYRLWKRQPLELGLLAWGYFVPGVLVLAVQGLVTYLLPGAEEGGIVFAPLAVEAAFSDHLLAKFLLSILFPLAVWLVQPRATRQDGAWLLAGLAFLVGAAQMYLLGEGGERLLHGNFRWGAQIGLFLWLAASLRLCLAHKPARPLVWVYLAHVAAGLAYYAYCITTAAYG